MREDSQKQKAQQSSCVTRFPSFIYDSALQFRLLQFFNRLEHAYKFNIFDENILREIFPFYIELRISILELAEVHNQDKKQALADLHNYLPRLHDYFETDIKRILKHRLQYFIQHNGLEEYKCLSLNQAQLKTDKNSELIYESDLRQLLHN